MHLFSKDNNNEKYLYKKNDTFNEKIYEEESAIQNSSDDFYLFNNQEEKTSFGDLNKLISILNKENCSIITPNIKFSNEVNDNIPSLEKEKNKIVGTIKNKKFIGIKRTGNFIGIHNKYSSDNLFRKVKSFLLMNLIEFINNLIKKIYNGNIGNGMLAKKLIKITKEKKPTVKENKDFIYKTLKEILSADVSKKITYYFKEHNKKLINELLNEEDKEKRKIFEKIFSLTFLECLDHFIGKKQFKELDGLKKFDKTFENEEKDYFDCIKEYALNFEKYIMNQKSRNRGKKCVINNDKK